MEKLDKLASVFVTPQQSRVTRGVHAESQLRKESLTLLFIVRPGRCYSSQSVAVTV